MQKECKEKCSEEAKMNEKEECINEIEQKCRECDEQMQRRRRLSKTLQRRAGKRMRQRMH